MAGLRQASLVLLALLAATPAGARKKQPPPPVAVPAPAPPSVRAGVELWRGGDYPAAVAMWQPFAAAGDPDAMFNLGQAYKLGRALPKDEAQAREWFRRAAVKGHRPAQANLGIMLFQAGEKAEAVRWLRAAADQDEMRAQYVLGVAYWNGDGAPRSLSLAYAYLTRAAALGLPEATAALLTLASRVSPTERADGSAVATSLATGKGVPAAFETRPPILAPVALAATDRPVMVAAVSQPVPTPRPTAPVVAPVPAAPVPVLAPPAVVVAVPVAVPVIGPPKPVPPVVIAGAKPGLTAPAATAAVAPTARATPMPTLAPSPASNTVAPVAVANAAVLRPLAPFAETPVSVGKPVKTVTVPPKRAMWRVQLGAYSKRALAEAAWKKVEASQKAAVAGIKPIYEAGVGITKLQLGPYGNEKLARDACAKIAFSGSACFVTSG